MSKYDRIVQNEKEIRAYLKRMVDAAAQKGIMITAVFVNSPCLDVGTDCITPYGQKHPELLIHSCGKVGLRALDLCEKEDYQDEFDS